MKLKKIIKDIKEFFVMSPPFNWLDKLFVGMLVLNVAIDITTTRYVGALAWIVCMILVVGNWYHRKYIHFLQGALDSIHNLLSEPILAAKKRDMLKQKQRKLKK